MKTKLFTLALSILTATSAFARIGEAQAQIESRFGKSLRSDKSGLPLFLYQKNGMHIGVVFIEGKSVAEFYSRSDKRELTENEIQLLLEANSFNGSWTKVGETPFWKLEPRGMTANYDHGRLAICTKEFVDASTAEKKKKEQDKLKDFWRQ